MFNTYVLSWSKTHSWETDLLCFANSDKQNLKTFGGMENKSQNHLYGLRNTCFRVLFSFALFFRVDYLKALHLNPSW